MAKVRLTLRLMRGEHVLPRTKHIIPPRQGMSDDEQDILATFLFSSRITTLYTGVKTNPQEYTHSYCEHSSWQPYTTHSFPAVW